MTTISQEVQEQREAEEREQYEQFAAKCSSVKFKIGPINIRLNPIVTIISAIIIWSFVIACVVKPVETLKEMKSWKVWITDKWTWLYIGTQDVWAVFIVVLYFSKYSNLKLGRDDEEPEFADGTYFTMLFAAGIGIGLFYFGVAEPIWHYQPLAPNKAGNPYGNRYWNRYTDNQRAQDAINITFFHWGIHGWIVYVVIGLLLAFLSYRKGLPMTMRTCFWPLLGDRIFGVIGDMIDILSVVCTMFGVCTSLGLGVIQLNAGFRRLNSKIKENTTNHIIIIWCITVLATASVISGIKLGIRRLSEICFLVGMFLLTVVFFYDDTWFLLNLYVQSIGYYLQWIMQIGFHTDAFAQLGNAPDGKESSNWMDGWTIFYWGWWIAWSPFVGMFIAKISRGRTIKDFITHTLTIPILYTFLWLTVFGGAALRMERNAANAGILCNSTLGGTTSLASANGLYRLSCRGRDDMWFDVVQQYGDLGTLLSVVSIIGIILYFVTSSDSGSLVIDCLSANGDPDPPIIQRVFWALTEGATATALLVAGGKDALNALQTASIAAGLPYTLILNFICVALWRAVQMELGDLDKDAKGFQGHILDYIFTLNGRILCKVFLAVFAPWYSLGKSASKLYSNGKYAWGYGIFLAILFYLWILFMILETAIVGISYVGWTILMGFVTYGTGIRSACRLKYKIEGNLYEDFFAFLLLYPCAVVQIAEQVEHGEEPESEVEAGVFVNQHVTVNGIPMEPKEMGNVNTYCVIHEENANVKPEGAPPAYQIALDISAQPDYDKTAL